MTFEEMGIKLRLNDFKMLFDVLDYDNRGTIDFSKFCHLNADRYTLIDLSRMVRIPSLIKLYRKLTTWKVWAEDLHLRHSGWLGNKL